MGGKMKLYRVFKIATMFGLLGVVTVTFAAATSKQGYQAFAYQYVQASKLSQADGTYITIINNIGDGLHVCAYGDGSACWDECYHRFYITDPRWRAPTEISLTDYNYTLHPFFDQLVSRHATICVTMNRHGRPKGKIC